MLTFEDLLPEILEKPSIHARMVNTFSMLEYIGTRKILKSQDAPSMTLSLLAHIQEEIRHAQMLKKLALDLSHGELTTYSEDHLFCGKEAREYFQTIDLESKKTLQESKTFQNYLLTTFLIEERAKKLYPVYERALETSGYAPVIRAILRDEENHLREVSEELKIPQENTSSLILGLREVEGTAFQKYLQAMSAELKKVR
jgi:hypothetical protein